MIIYIEPRSSFRPLSSDTLYGAVVNTLQILSQNFDELLASLAKRPPFLISSAFPFVKNGTEIIHFFPKPITKTPEGTNIYNYAHKELKKSTIRSRDYFQ